MMNTTHNLEKIEQSKTAHGRFQILLGIAFLIVISGAAIFGSSIWIVLGLLPFYGISLKAYLHYREDGYLSKRVLNTLIYCVFTLVVIMAIIFGFDMSRLWPISVIAIGLATILVNRR
jgi:hypothetical protein